VDAVNRDIENIELLGEIEAENNRQRFLVRRRWQRNRVLDSIARKLDVSEHERNRLSQSEREAL